LLLLFPLMPQGTAITVHEGERHPMRGWLPIDWGQRYMPAPMIRLAASSYDPWNAHFATVLVPFPGDTPPAVRAESVGPDIHIGDRSAGRLELRWHDGSSDLLVWTPRLGCAIDNQHGLETDACLVHLHLSPDAVVRGGLLVDSHRKDGLRALLAGGVEEVPQPRLMRL
jgi:hypothetical protein